MKRRTLLSTLTPLALVAVTACGTESLSPLGSEPHSTLALVGEPEVNVSKTLPGLMESLGTVHNYDSQPRLASIQTTLLTEDGKIVAVILASVANVQPGEDATYQGYGQITDALRANPRVTQRTRIAAQMRVVSQ